MPDEDSDSEMERRKAVRELYHATRCSYVTGHLEVTRDFDKWALGVAGAALGLSFTFLKDLVPLSGSVYLWLVSASWSALGLAVGIMLAALMAGASAHRAYYCALDEAAAAVGPTEDLFKRAKAAQASSKRAKFADLGRWAALVLTLLGIALMCVFVLVNARGGVDHQPLCDSPTASATANVSTATATAKSSAGNATATGGSPTSKSGDGFK